MKLRIGLISDTHSYIDERIIEHLKSCDEIWHAGDIGNLEVTDKLKELAPIRVVYGNIDNHLARAEFPKDEIFEIQGVKFYMTHIGGKPGKYYSNVAGIIQKEKPNIFICGHSHICKVQMDSKYNCLYMNPGAAGKHGFHKVRTLLRFDISNGKLENLEVVELGTRG